MIDKLLLNNQIITNKKKIQQARIQTINKLVQKIRKLKLLNEKKPKNAKIQKNLDKIPKIMQCLKKLKIVDIIRKILTFSRKPTAILTNGQAQPDDIAIALLACNKILGGFVETLRTLLTLNDTNPGWQDEILELSRRKKKIIESSERKKNKRLKSGGKQPKILVKKLEWKEENLKSNERNQMDNTVDTAQAKGWKEEPISKTIEEPSSPQKLAQNKPKQNDKRPKSVLPSENFEELDEPINDKPVTIVDSFFFTQTGDNYMSTVVIDRAQPEPIQDGLARRERRDTTIRPNKRNNIFRKQSVPNMGDFDRKGHTVQSGRIEKGQSFGQKSNLKSHQSVASDEKLHPSWAAKQKLKANITEFKGNKITFDNEGNDTTEKSFNNKLNKHGSQQVKDISTASSQQNLHPSWVAKQLQKPTIAEFKGTKITFDE